jgi:lysosomal acid lipase/cholesteryl ester hydrolase
MHSAKGSSYFYTAAGQRTCWWIGATMFFRFLALCLTVCCVAQNAPNASNGSVIRPNETIPEYLGKYGIPVEEHWVTTEDGYILAIFRMSRPGAPVLLLQHGILCSAWHWMVNSPSIAPAIQLYHEGYDIWLTNTRGNTYSRNHTTLDPKHNKEFWNFTFAEMGRFDVPANIEYVLKQTKKPTLTFMGWSQGVTQFFVSMTDPKVKAYVDKTVNLFVAMNPVTWMKHQTAKLFTVVTDIHLDQMWDEFFPYGFLNWKSAPAEAQLACKLTKGAICEGVVDIIAGNSSLDTAGAIENLTAHFPAGVSAKELVHYAQSIRSNYFRDFDYGKRGNMKQYGRATPPEYDMTKISVPTALFCGDKDTMADVDDVATLVEHIGSNPALVYKKTFPGFSHMTFFTGTAGSFQRWFPDLLGLLQKYNPAATFHQCISGKCVKGATGVSLETCHSACLPSSLDRSIVV